MKPTLTLLAVLLASLAAFVDEPSSRAEPAFNPSLASIEDVAGLPRVLFIGDSVSIGYALPTRKLPSPTERTA